MQVSPINYNNTLNSKMNTAKQGFGNQTTMQNLVSFNGTPAKSKFFEPAKKVCSPFYRTMNNLKTKMAFGIAKILETKTAKNIIQKTSKSKLLAAHLSTFTSVVLSGFYIKKTLENDKLDTSKKRTLAINQGIVCGLSTICAYTINGFLDKKIDKFSDKFLAINGKEPIKKLAMYKDGIRTAAQIMIFMTIYRFIAPVFATPIANKIGNNIEEKNNAKKTNEKTVSSNNK